MLFLVSGLLAWFLLLRWCISCVLCVSQSSNFEKGSAVHVKGLLVVMI